MEELAAQSRTTNSPESLENARDVVRILAQGSAGNQHRQESIRLRRCPDHCHTIRPLGTYHPPVQITTMAQRAEPPGIFWRRDLFCAEWISHRRNHRAADHDREVLTAARTPKLLVKALAAYFTAVLSDVALELHPALERSCRLTAPDRLLVFSPELRVADADIFSRILEPGC